MKRSYIRLAPIVTALFALGVALPRAGFLYHEHSRGERLHIHAEGDAPHAEHARHDHKEAHGTFHSHEHDEHHTVGTARHHHHQATALETDRNTHSGHWHDQQRFQRGVAATLPFVQSVASAGTVAERSPTLAARVAAADLRARGPPPSPLS